MTTDSTHIQTLGLVFSIIFYVFTFLLLPLLIGLAFNKKKFLLYIDEINTSGQIKNKIPFNIIFDIKLAKYIFKDITMATLEKDEIYKIQTLTRLREKIKTLTIVSQQITIALIIGTITVVILRTFFK